MKGRLLYKATESNLSCLSSIIHKRFINVITRMSTTYPQTKRTAYAAKIVHARGYDERLKEQRSRSFAARVSQARNR